MQNFRQKYGKEIINYDIIKCRALKAGNSASFFAQFIVAATKLMIFAEIFFFAKGIEYLPQV